MTFPAAPTRIIVVVLLFLAMAWAIWSMVATVPARVALIILLALEGWTFLDKKKDNAISNVMWELSRMPLVPMLWGAFVVALIFGGYFPFDIRGMLTATCVGLLSGHFFFPRTIERDHAA